MASSRTRSCSSLQHNHPCSFLVLVSCAMLASTLAGLGGCGSDTRITMEQLHELEQATEEEPLELRTQELCLTDVRPYTVTHGDILNVTMTGLRLEDRYAPVLLQLRVYEDGAVTIPVVGKVPVAGKTLAEAEAAIMQAHSDVVADLAVHLDLAGPENTTVLVKGAVTDAGLIRLPENERNLLYALSAAGGFSNATSGVVHYEPIRADREDVVLDLKQANDVRRALLMPPLESGDIVTVESASQDIVYVTGLVNIPGLVPVPRNGEISLVRAVSASGGLLDFLEPAEATLWRKLPDGNQARVKIELAKVMSGELPDVALRPGDVLDIPHTPETRVRQWAISNLRFGPFGFTAIYDPVADYRARVLRGDNSDSGNFFQRTLLQSLGTQITNLAVPLQTGQLP